MICTVQLVSLQLRPVHLTSSTLYLVPSGPTVSGARARGAPRQSRWCRVPTGSGYTDQAPSMAPAPRADQDLFFRVWRRMHVTQRLTYRWRTDDRRYAWIGIYAIAGTACVCAQSVCCRCDCEASHSVMQEDHRELDLAGGPAVRDET